MKEGNDTLEKYLAGDMKDINGWKIGSVFGDSAFYNGDWLMRAACANGGIYGGQGEGSELAAGIRRPDLPRHAPLLAADGSAFHPSRR
jgi:hypothetical protein